ncbi:CLUMA_CG017543, isoform A [Clunio marinus]|uniref:CLUMA_CG017543, isoform A n=1 Tax=Clunio marinus TaxID=568069 RepID=A0A1J1IY18_9DIPT|nr:CLUMA_CG017543, isoform A [Clunio marinus]
MSQINEKRRTISIKDKLKVIEKAKCGESRANLMKEFNIGSSTLSAIIKYQKSIELKARENPLCLESKRMKPAKFQRVDEALMVWVRQMRTGKFRLTGRIIKQKALEFAESMGIVDFKASEGWLCNFQRRNGIIRPRQGNAISSKLNIDDSNTIHERLTNNWIQLELVPLLAEFPEENIFNLDEFGIFWKATPSRSSELRGETCSDGKLSRNRLSILIGANMSGTEKLPLLIIGKSENPRCFRNVKSQVKSLYRNNLKAWMTPFLFEDFFVEWDKQLQVENRFVVAIVDNCSAHTKSVSYLLKNIRLVFFPSNCSSVPQPMNMGIVKNFKQLYRTELVSNHMKIIDGKESIENNVLEAIDILVQSWDKISPQTISNCFNTAGWKQDFMIDEQIYDWDPLEQMQIDEKFINFDNNLVSSGLLTDEEILQTVAEKDEDDCDNFAINEVQYKEIDNYETENPVDNFDFADSIGAPENNFKVEVIVKEETDHDHDYLNITENQVECKQYDDDNIADCLRAHEDSLLASKNISAEVLNTFYLLKKALHF